MSGPAGSDPYLDPASGVLRNPLGITDPGELAQVEAALSASRLVDLERRRLPGSYDLDHLRAFHRYILGDVFGWTGELRTVSIAKGSLFCLPQHLATVGADVFGRLATANRLRGLNREEFIGRVVEFNADVNALHPFREGNGRAQRAFFSQLATTLATTSTGSEWTPTSTSRRARAAHHGDLTTLTEMLSDLIDRPNPPGPPSPGGRRAA